jgi:glycosyltransferase involved in cell wall biosynthesis
MVVISVIVPVRDGLPWLEDQLTALARQRFGQPWELIVVDNGSTDGSGDLARRWAERDDRITVIDGSDLGGAAAARNAGARHARGGLLAFCDADDVVGPDWLAACAETSERADVVAGVFDLTSLNGLPPSAPVPASMRQLPHLPAGLSANLAVQKSAFDAVGGFAEDLTTGEDVDLCWRLQESGHPFALATGAVVSKRDRTGFREVFAQAAAYGRGAPVLYRRHRSAGAGRNLSGAARSWVWLVVHLPDLVRPGPGRTAWARGAGMRTGRLVGSVRERVFYP